MSASVKVVTTESEGALQMFLIEDNDSDFNADSLDDVDNDVSDKEDKIPDEAEKKEIDPDFPTTSEEKASEEAALKTDLQVANSDALVSFDKPSRRSLRLKAGKKPLSYKIKSDDEDLLVVEAQLSSLIPAENPSAEAKTLYKPYVCLVCGMTCKTLANLKQHEKTHSHSDKPHVCVQCSYACKRKSDLKKHEETHGPSNAFKCMECDYSGKRLKYLKKHMRTHNREFAFSCHICQYRCRSKSTFDKHLVSHSCLDEQMLEDVEMKPFNCEQCGECFETKLSLNRHLEAHSDHSPFFCVVCGAAFKTKEFLRKHEEQHKNNTSKGIANAVAESQKMVTIKQEVNEDSNSSNATIIFDSNSYENVKSSKNEDNCSAARMKGGHIPCPLCNYSCSTTNLLRRHMRKHSDVKPFVCTQCGAAFKRKDHLKVHKNTHSNVRPHTCPHCAYSTHRKYRLKLHILTHQTVKPLSCPSCDYRCRRYCELTYHMKTKHKVEVENSESETKSENPGELIFKCDKCEYTCDSIKRLKYHTARHENKTPHSCPHCDYKCSSRSSLSDHLLRHAGLKPCLCSICGAAFRNTSRLNRHKLVHSDIKPHGCDFCDFSSRSKYNLKQHMLRHTDQDRTRRRRKPKAPQSLVSPPPTATEIIKQSFQGDIQPLISQLTSTAFLESLHQPQSLSQLFPDQPEPLKLTDHQLSVTNQLFKNKQSNGSDQLKQKSQGSGSSPDPVVNRNPFQPDHSGALTQPCAYTDRFQNPNPFLSQNNAVLYSPGMTAGHHNPDYNYLDRNGTTGYGYPSSYFYNETVFPGSMGTNMNFYMNSGANSSYPADASLNLAQTSPSLNHSSGSTGAEQATSGVSNELFSRNNNNGYLDSSVSQGELCEDIAKESSKLDRKCGKSASKPTHICIECGYIALTNTMLQRHKMTHVDLKPFKCELCEKAFKRRDHLKAHMRTHDTDKPYTCSLCPYTCSRKYRLALHEKTHASVDHEVCSICEIVYPTVEEMKEHFKIHCDGGMYMCDKCDFKCVTEDDLKSHAEGHKSFPCEKCSYVCRSIKEFASHRKMHDEKEELTCSVCNYTCDSPKRLKYHMERHDNKTPLACPQCDYKCSSRSSLSDHLLQHEGVKPFLCAICGMSFRNVSRLNRHKLTHSDVKPHVCDYCPFSSRSRYNLKQHMSRHFK